MKCDLKNPKNLRRHKYIGPSTKVRTQEQSMNDSNFTSVLIDHRQRSVVHLTFTKSMLNIFFEEFVDVDFTEWICSKFADL